MPVFTTSIRPRVLLRPLVPSRTLFGWLRGKGKTLDPTSEEFMRKKKAADSLPAPQHNTGALAKGSILDDGTEVPVEQEAAGNKPAHMDPALTAMALDPKPMRRKYWERKMVMRDIRRGQRINKATLLARTERVHRAKSRFIKTSMKKLMPLARQIAGKPIDEAIVQMRFSKKKAAADVLAHLERTRDEATVKAGMGLGPIRRKLEAEKLAAQQEEEGKSEGNEAIPEDRPTRMLVIDKKGNKRIVHDTTNMYVEQAWIGRGTPDHGIDRRARGKRHRTDRPFTSKFQVFHCLVKDASLQTWCARANRMIQASLFSSRKSRRAYVNRMSVLTRLRESQCG